MLLHHITLIIKLADDDGYRTGGDIDVHAGLSIGRRRGILVFTIGMHQGTGNCFQEHLNRNTFLGFDGLQRLNINIHLFT